MVDDIFHITSTKLPNSALLTGTLTDDEDYEDYLASEAMNDLSMPTCDSSEYNGTWQFILSELSDSWTVRGWKDFRLPTMNVTFDASTANLTVDGIFAASPFVRPNRPGHPDGALSTSGGVLGKTRFTFHGVLDPYHSDILDMNASSPTWLRTVGFGNNSANIGNSIGNAASGRLGPSWLTVIFAAGLSMLSVYSRRGFLSTDD